jgi:hypothetical protein
MRCEGTSGWRDELVDKRFASTNPETGIRRIAASENKHNWQKIGLYLNKYKENGKGYLRSMKMKQT